jgi:hypothetical protein
MKSVSAILIGAAIGMAGCHGEEQTAEMEMEPPYTSGAEYEQRTEQQVRQQEQYGQQQYRQQQEQLGQAQPSQPRQEPIQDPFAEEQQPSGQGGGRMGQQSPMASACPILIEGAQVSTENIDQGVAMTFRTSRPADVQELRDSVRAMAQQHERAAQQRGSSQHGGHGMGRMPNATVSVRDTPDGARLELRAVNMNDVSALRQHGTMHADHMRTNRACPAMGEMPA